MLRFSTRSVAATLALATAAGFGSAAQPARADTASTAAIAGIAGLVIGSLLFDSSRNQYYYVDDGRRRFVTNAQAQTWYRRRDPRYYEAHRARWNDHAQFAHDWNRDHGPRGNPPGRGPRPGPPGHDHH